MIHLRLILSEIGIKRKYPLAYSIQRSNQTIDLFIDKNNYLVGRERDLLRVNSYKLLSLPKTACFLFVKACMFPLSLCLNRYENLYWYSKTLDFLKVIRSQQNEKRFIKHSEKSNYTFFAFDTTLHSSYILEKKTSNNRYRNTCWYKNGNIKLPKNISSFFLNYK